MTDKHTPRSEPADGEGDDATADPGGQETHGEFESEPIHSNGPPVDESEHSTEVADSDSPTEETVETDTDEAPSFEENSGRNELDIGGLDDDIPVEEVIATVSTMLRSGDRNSQSDIIKGLTVSVLQDWTRAFDHVRPGVSVEREDNARLQQVRKFYEEREEDYQRLAGEFGINSYRSLEPSQVLFMTDLRQLQETFRDQLPAEPNADPMRLAELFNDRIDVSDSVQSNAESVLSDEFSDLRGHPIGDRLRPDTESRGYRVSDPADRLRTILGHRSLPIEDSDDGPDPGDVVFLHANGEVNREAVSINSEGYIGCVVLGAPVTGDQDWFDHDSESDTLYSFRRLYLSGNVAAVDLSCETAALSLETLQSELEALLTSASRVGESAERSPQRADQLSSRDIVTESIIVFRTLRSHLVELPAVVVERPFDEWIPADILSGLYFPNRQGERTIGSIESTLRSGKNVILTGPPGTGKTEIAERVLTYLENAYPNYYTGSKTTSATADWSTFDTIGGYMPDRTSNTDELVFDPGLVMRCLQDTQTGQQLNEPVLIDELNRADIDKAFGQLFTALTDQSVELPFRTNDDEPLRIETPTQAGTVPDDEAYLLPQSWSLIGTINSYDKTSLYEMSYAFMRRFSFIRVDPPTVPAQHSERNELLAAYAAAWGYNVDPDKMIGGSTTPMGQLLANLGTIWYAINSATQHRAIGPAIIEDMLETITSHRRWETITTHSIKTPESSSSNPPSVEFDEDHILRELLTEAVVGYVLPQLEGLPEREAIATNIAETKTVEQKEFVSAVRASLELPELSAEDLDGTD